MFLSKAVLILSLAFAVTYGKPIGEHFNVSLSQRLIQIEYFSADFQSLSTGIEKRHHGGTYRNLQDDVGQFKPKFNDVVGRRSYVISLLQVTEGKASAEQLVNKEDQFGNIYSDHVTQKSQCPRDSQTDTGKCCYNRLGHLLEPKAGCADKVEMTGLGTAEVYSCKPYKIDPPSNSGLTFGCKI